MQNTNMLTEFPDSKGLVGASQRSFWSCNSSDGTSLCLQTLIIFFNFDLGLSLMVPDEALSDTFSYIFFVTF